MLFLNCLPVHYLSYLLFSIRFYFCPQYSATVLSYILPSFCPVVFYCPSVECFSVFLADHLLTNINSRFTFFLFSILLSSCSILLSSRGQYSASNTASYCPLFCQSMDFISMFFKFSKCSSNLSKYFLSLSKCFQSLFKCSSSLFKCSLSLSKYSSTLSKCSSSLFICSSSYLNVLQVQLCKYSSSSAKCSSSSAKCSSSSAKCSSSSAKCSLSLAKCSAMADRLTFAGPSALWSCDVLLLPRFLQGS